MDRVRGLPTALLETDGLADRSRLRCTELRTEPRRSVVQGSPARRTDNLCRMYRRGCCSSCAPNRQGDWHLCGCREPLSRLLSVVEVSQVRGAGTAPMASAACSRDTRRRHHQLTALIARNQCAATPAVAAHPPATSTGAGPCIDAPGTRQLAPSAHTRRTPTANHTRAARTRRQTRAPGAATRSASSNARPGTHALRSRAGGTPAGERHDDLPNRRQEACPKSRQSGPGKSQRQMTESRGHGASDGPFALAGGPPSPPAPANQQPMPATAKSGPEHSLTDVRLLPLLPLLYSTAVPAAQPFELCS